MKKTICGKNYDTETATIVKKVTVGNFGDLDGFEETLYQTPENLYFLYTNGGEKSKYTAEKIERLSKVKAEKWLEENK